MPSRCAAAITTRLVPALHGIVISWAAGCWQSAHGGEGDRDRLLGAAVVLFIVLFQVVFLLTLLLFSLGWGFIRPALRSKEGWLVSRLGVVIVAAGVVVVVVCVVVVIVAFVVRLLNCWVGDDCRVVLPLV